MNRCDSYGNCQQGFNCPARTSKFETRGQTLHAERKWGETPIKFIGKEPMLDRFYASELAQIIVGCLLIALGFIGGTMAIYSLAECYPPLTCAILQVVGLCK